MFHPSILAAYGYARVYSQRNCVDACIDVAEYYGLRVSTLARFLMRMHIVAHTDADRLSLLA